MPLDSALLFHVFLLVLGAAMVVGLYFALKKKSVKTQTTVLGLLSFSGTAAVIYNLLMWGTPLEYLPLHLCSINALLLPATVWTRSKTMGNLLLLWSLGALLALVVNREMMSMTYGFWTMFFYYFPHVMEFGIPILLFKLGLVEKTPKCIGPTIGLTIAIYTGIHLVNKGINAWCAFAGIMSGDEILQVNYMYSIVPEFPPLDMFYKLIPYEYWYMYLAFPIVAVYLLAVYAPELIREKKKAKTAAE